jgi:hypothetical protein
MQLRIVALYPTRISALAGKPDIRFRSRKKLHGTLVPCRVRAVNGRSIAVPAYPIPDGTPPPRYRVQIETVRVAVDDRQAVYVLLSAEPEAVKTDPEQVLMSPIFDDGHRMIFEFQRAQVLTVSKRGELELRFVAVHPVLGVVGTKTTCRFNTRFSALAMRCTEYLAGAVDLFPFRERPSRMSRYPIPEGEADLSFDTGIKPSRQNDPEVEAQVWPAGDDVQPEHARSGDPPEPKDTPGSAP